MPRSDETSGLPRILEGLDLTADVDNVMHVEATFVPDAGKVRYKTRKKGGGLAKRRPERTPDQDQRDGRKRAIRTMQEIAHAHHLDHFVTLTFSSPVTPEAATKAWDRAKRSKAIGPIGPYVYALEYAWPNTFLHIHAMTGKDAAERLKEHWPHGWVDIRQVPWEEVDFVCAYIGKDFDKFERPIGRRYRASRGSRPVRQQVILTDEIALYSLTVEASRGREVCSIASYENGLGRYGQLAWNPHDEA